MRELPDPLQVSLRLKAARYLAGGTDGKPTPLPTAELARHPDLIANKVTRNRLEEFEQMKTQARPAELAVIARALGQADDWFTA